MKYRKLKGAPPNVFVAGKAVGTVPIEITGAEVRQNRAHIKKLVASRFIEEVGEAPAPKPEPPPAPAPEPEPEVDTEPTPMEGHIDGVDDNVAAPFVEPEPEPEAYNTSAVDRSVAKLKKHIGKQDDVDYLRALLDAESAKEYPRTTAIGALEERLGELEG